MPKLPKFFRFVERVDAFRDNQAKVVHVAAGIADKAKLMRLLAKELHLPAYFGANWDALDECLREPATFGDAQRVVLVHQDVPFSPRGTLRRSYLEVLQNAAQSWSTDDVHSLVAVFPKSAVDDVAAALAND